MSKYLGYNFAFYFTLNSEKTSQYSLYTFPWYNLNNYQVEMALPKLSQFIDKRKLRYSHVNFFGDPVIVRIQAHHYFLNIISGRSTA